MINRSPAIVHSNENMSPCPCAVRKSGATLPQSTITYSPYGDSVFIIEESTNDQGETQLVAQTRFVQTGDTRGDQVAILSGISIGEQVVTAGQIKLRNGSRIVIDNTVAVSNQPNPMPEIN
jgi:membrane fusion protein (multidrug efflux system)